MPSVSLQQRLYDLLALLAGLLLTLSYAPFAYWPLAFVCLATLFWLWQRDSLKRACWRGLLFGLGLYGSGASWVYVSIHEFGHTPAIAAGLLTMGFVLLLAVLTPVACAWVYRRFFSRATPVAIVLALPALWLLFEWLRGVIFTGFPWLNVGYSQTDSMLNSIAPLLGVYGVCYVVALLATLLMLIITRSELRVFFICAVAIILGFVWFLQDIPWSRPLNEPLKITLLQGNVSQHDKWQPGQREIILQRYKKLAAENLDSDLIIWPETAIPAFFHDVMNDYLADIERLAKDSKTDMLIGVPVKLTQAGQVSYFNSMVSVGQEQTFYHKRHLVPFGEYVPFGDLIRQIGGFFNLPMSDFRSGELLQPQMQVAGHVVGISICYEDAFGEEVILALPEASLLVNVSNDAWFGDSLAPHQHLQIARMRALETARPLVRATNTGITAVIDHLGIVQNRIPQFMSGSLTTAVQPMHGATPYVLLGNAGILWLVLISLVLAVFLSRQAR